MRRQHGQKLEIIPNTLETCGEVIERSLAVAKYQKLVEPFKIGNVELRNRFVMLPMTIEKVDNYHVTDDLVDFYEQRAKGHAGLIEIGSCYVCDCFGTEPKYHTTTGACGCWDDEFIPGFQRIAEVCHKHGSKVAAQLQLCYEWRASGDDPLLSYAPSKDVPSGPFVGMPEREYTKEEIAEVVKQYGQAARRCKDAGIDIIEIHAGIGYMVMRFLSKYSNHRTDEYGGSAENRARFLCEIIDEIHKTCGDDMPILVRISADDLMPDGNRIADTLELIPIIEAHGVDAWSVQAGFHEAPRPVANQIVPEGEFIDLAKQVKTVTSKPVFPGTRINTLDMCEKVVTEGYGDAVGMARQFIADPDTARKVEEGRPEQVRPCIVCSRCLDNIFIGKPCQCSVNANVWEGVEVGLPQDKPATEKQHIAVVGAGPGGLEAARVAAERGHKVTVLEKSDKLAGLLTMAQVLNANIEPLVSYWNEIIKQYPNIEVKLNTKVDVNTLKALNPDQVIVSPGGGIIPIDVPGIDGKNVVKSEDIKAMCNGIVPEGKGMIWKAAVAAINAHGPEHEERPDRHRGQARGSRGRRLRRPGSGRGHVRRPRDLGDRSGQEARQRHRHHRQEPHHQPAQEEGRAPDALDRAHRGDQEGRQGEERRDRRGAAHRVRHRADLPRRGAEHRPVRRDREGVAACQAHRRRHHPRRQGVPHPRGRQGRLPGLHGHLNGLIPGCGRWVETARRPLSQFGSNAQAF